MMVAFDDEIVWALRRQIERRDLQLQAEREEYDDFKLAVLVLYEYAVDQDIRYVNDDLDAAMFTIGNILGDEDA